MTLSRCADLISTRRRYDGTVLDFGSVTEAFTHNFVVAEAAPNVRTDDGRGRDRGGRVLCFGVEGKRSRRLVCVICLGPRISTSGRPVEEDAPR